MSLCSMGWPGICDPPPSPLERLYGYMAYTHGNTAFPCQSHSVVTGYGSEEAGSDGKC